VNCGIIAFCDKISFLTGHVLVLQRDMRVEIETMKKAMKEEIENERIENRKQLLMMQVSSLSRTSNLHDFTLIHRGVDIMSSDCCAICTSLYHMPCILTPIIGNYFARGGAVVEALRYKLEGCGFDS
jgi:hypothetical protein